MSLLLRVAALVLFILAAVFVWVTTMTLDNVVAVIAAGLGCWVASTLPLPSP